MRSKKGKKKIPTSFRSVIAGYLSYHFNSFFFFLLLLLLVAFFRGLCSARPLIRSTTFLFQSTVKVFFFFFFLRWRWREMPLNSWQNQLNSSREPIKTDATYSAGHHRVRLFVCTSPMDIFFFFLSISIHFLKGIFRRIFGSTVSYTHAYIYGCVRACVFSWKIVVFDGCIETLMHKTLNSGATRQLPQGYASGITNQVG